MAKTTEVITAELQALRKRIEAQYPAAGQGTASASAQSSTKAGTFPATPADAPADPLPLVDLLPLFHARDAAEGKVAAIGKVNPRPGGPLNAAIQATKRLVARTLQWFVRDQVDFNFATVRALSETMEALNEVNRALAAASSRLTRVEQLVEARIREESANTILVADDHLREATDNLSGQTRAVDAALRQLYAEQRDQTQQQLGSLQEAQQRAAHQAAEAIEELRQRADHAVRDREREDIRLLRTLADVQNAFMQRLAMAEAEWKSLLETRVAQAEERGEAATQQAIADGRARLDAVVHEELRLLRQRVGAILAQPVGWGITAATDAKALQAARALTAESGFLDEVRFADRFRGSVESVKQKLGVHVSAFRGQAPVFDLGCGRGEFLALLQQEGIEAVGVDSNTELVRMVHATGQRAVEDDLLHFLQQQPPDSAGGIFCAHVIEHLPPQVLVCLVAEAHRVLRPGGVFLLETPNPSCLAIFATYFYLDPTHIRPVPSELLQYLLEEKGFSGVSVSFLHPAEQAFASLKPLDDAFRQQFFGCLDYAIRAHKPAAAGNGDRR